MPTIDHLPPDPATDERGGADAVGAGVGRSDPISGPTTLAELVRAMRIVPTPMMVTDLSARIEFVNEAAANLLGRDAAELRGRSVELILPTDFLPRVPVLIDLIRRHGRLEGSFPALRADGSDLLLDVIVEIATTAPDGAQWLVTTMRDLSEQVRTIEQLSASALGLARRDEETLLVQTIQEARRLIGTRYAAIGTVGDGRITRFITDGFSPEQVARIGHQPEGLGLLGAMQSEDRTLRLAEISDDPRSVGFPDGHPPMHSFLGTRIQVDGETYGHLYLTEKIGAPEFSVLDERLAELFAAHAAIAIRHGRQTSALEASVASVRRNEERLVKAQRIAAVGSWEWDIVTDLVTWSDEQHRIFGVEPGTFDGTEDAFLAFVHPDERDELAASDRGTDADSPPYEATFRIIRPDGSVRLIREAGTPLVDTVTGLAIGLIGTSTDITDQVAADAERARLASAVEQAAESIIIYGADRSIVYVNPSFTRLYGYASNDVVGHPPDILNSGHHTDAFWEAVWDQVRSGTPWTGLIVNRRADGGTLEVETVIASVVDGAGAVASFVQTDRDVTRERELETAMLREAYERETIESALQRIDPATTVEEMAAVACGEIMHLPGIEAAWAIELVAGRGRVIASAGIYPIAPGYWIPEARALHLAEHAALGPWTEPWSARRDYGTYGEELAATGIRTVAIAPLHGSSASFGVLLVGSTEPPETSNLVERLPALATFGSIVGALAAPQWEKRRQALNDRTGIEAIIESRSFWPVFQPIVELRSGLIVGHEALTRFEDGRRPDVVFGFAALAGAGIELELATLRDALLASAVLPSDTYLNLNVSPDLVRSRKMKSLLAGATRPIALELTEHAVIDDYDQLRDDLKFLGGNVRLAVDDAGAGYASLRHILELKPDFVKLDIALVHRINRDAARQALIAGIGYFATRRRIRLVAEGIETAAELRTITELGIWYGQGYLLGRPRDARGMEPWPIRVMLPT
ncbi:MAG: EAL domain-containing protein [Chloroflexota bacterium]